MNWLNFEKAKTLKQAVERSHRNVGFCEDYSAIKLKLYGKFGSWEDERNRCGDRDDVTQPEV